MSLAAPLRKLADSGSDWIFKSLDAAMTAPLKPQTRAKELIRAVVRARSSNYNRVSSFLRLLDKAAPGVSGRVARRLLRIANLPIAGYRVSLLAYGSGATVFLLESENGGDRMVLKVFRRSLGKPARRAIEVAREFKEKHRLLSEWFNREGEDPVVIPSSFLALHGPLLGAKSAGVVQPYVEGKVYDLFLDFSVEEVAALAEKDECLGGQIIYFARQVFAVWEERGLCFDLVGKENLMIVEHGGKLRLKIADNGILDAKRIKSQSPQLYDRLQSQLRHLQKILTTLERREIKRQTA